MRTKSVSYLFEDISIVSKKYPLTFIKFHDDVFGVSTEWLTEFTDRYPKEIGLPFVCYARPKMITEEYCQQLKKAGCYSVIMGVESGNEQLRNVILHRNLSDEQILSAAENLKSVGIRVYTNNMVGLPGETEKEIFETIEINQRARIDFAHASIFQPYPGTNITEYCKRNGFLDGSAKNVEGQFTVSILNFDSDFKAKIYILQKLFTVLVDYPKLRLLTGLLYKIEGRWFAFILNFVYRFYYGFYVHKRIYTSQISFKLCIRGAFHLFFSKNRT